MKYKKVILLGTSCLISGMLVYYLLAQGNWKDWQRILFHLKPAIIFWYLLLYGAGLLLRTFRYQLLLKSAETLVLPSFGQLILVTGVRNMLADFLPARVGSLSYIVLLNRVYKVDLSPCLTSFTYAFLFDLLALPPLLALALLVEGLTSGRMHPWLWGLCLIITAAALALILFLGPLIEKTAAWASRKVLRQERFPRLKELDSQLQALGQTLYRFKQARIFWPALGLSLIIRTVKYLLLFLLLYAVIQALTGQNPQLPIWVVFLGLLASEAAAGLPVSGIAGFGFYEGVLGAVLTGQGLDPSQAVLVSFSMHFFTQVVDYSLGGGALIFILLRLIPKKN
jgi:hypothetical protein